MIAKKFPILGSVSDYGFLWPIAKGLAARGHNVVVISWKNKQSKREIIQDGVVAYYLGESFARNEKDFPYLAKQKFEQLHSNKPFHIVHSIDSSGIEIANNKKNYKVAVTFDIDATEISQLYSIMAMSLDTPGDLIRSAIAVAYKFLRTYFTKDRKILKSADGVFVTHLEQKLLLERHYFYPDRKTFIVPYGLEVGDLTTKSIHLELKEKLKIPPGANTILTISDMHELGELKSLLRAFEKVAIKRPNARLIIVGDGPVFKSAEFEMLNLALGGKVEFTGAVSNQDIPDYISLCDVYIDLSSRSSGFDPNLIEAMAQKKVIIGSELNPIATIVENGIDGFLIRPADVGSLTQRFTEIFSHEVPLEVMGERAHHKVKSIFNTNKMVDQTLSAYFETLKNSGNFKTHWWNS
jgi:1,2-diacylglycerol 3-alpha-glucosyltransferase